MAQYITTKDLRELATELKKKPKYFKSKKFLKFIANKALEEVRLITRQSLSGISDEDTNTNIVSKYYNAHQVDIGSDYIIVFNDAMESVQDKEMSTEAKARYPNGISIAYIVEYGTGIRGTSTDDWITQMNINRDYTKGWTYKRDGNFYSTLGSEGKFVYRKLMDAVDLKFDGWVREYANKEMK